jgi:RNA polymerase sigma factor (sigma-70 family)
MIQDAELLQRYASTGDEAAFAEIVRRRVDLVYGVALRKVAGDTALAKDVTQSVFIDLTRKAASLARHPALEGWLFTSARFAAAKAIRSANRRRTHEEQAHAMHEQTTDPVDWEAMRPTLDDLVGELSGRDREAVVLRFFGGASFIAMAARLGISEDGARSRVERALEKIRTRLARRGVRSTRATMALALANQVGLAAPVGLAANVTSAALAGATASGAGPLIFMSLSKTTAVILGALAVAGGAIAWREHRANLDLSAKVTAARTEVGSLREENQRQAAAARVVEARLREDLNAVGRRQQAAERAAAKPAVGLTAPLPPGMRPIAEFKNAGKASPSAAIGQMLWAASNGDIDLLASVIALDPAARAKVEELLATLPESSRQQYGAPEKLIALLLADDAPVLRAIQVVGQDPAPGDDNREQLDVRVLTSDGDSKKFGFHFRRFNDGWRAYLPPDFIEKVLLPKLTGESSSAAKPK